MTEVINTIKDVGITVVIVGYFIWKDARFNSSLEKTLQALCDSVGVLQDILRDIGEK